MSVTRAEGAAASAATSAGEEARHLASEAKEQVGSLLGRSRDELQAQAQTRSQEAGAALRRLAVQMQSLSAGRPEEAPRVREYLDMAEARLSTWADRLEHGGPQVVLDDVKAFARRRPGAFLAMAAGLGFAAARLTRAGAAAAKEQHDGQMTRRDLSSNGIATAGTQPYGAMTGTSTSSVQGARSSYPTTPTSYEDPRGTGSTGVPL